MTPVYEVCTKHPKLHRYGYSVPTSVKVSMFLIGGNKNNILVILRDAVVVLILRRVERWNASRTV